MKVGPTLQLFRTLAGQNGSDPWQFVHGIQEDHMILHGVHPRDHGQDKHIVRNPEFGANLLASLLIGLESVRFDAVWNNGKAPCSISQLTVNASP